jgi:ATP-dependent DNA helicase PIF1
VLSNNLEINPKFQEALQLLEETSSNLFITGKAGTGKSTLLNYFRSITDKDHIVLAPTGIAAVNINGETIHSFFKFQPGINVMEAVKIANNIKDKELYRNLDMIIIDEISMVRADLLDCVDIFLKKIRKSELPFGGVQMIFIGDLLQLPPVVVNDER